MPYYLILLALLFSSSLFANGRYILDEYAPQTAYGGVHMVNNGQDSFYSLGISPDLHWKKLKFGADIFIYVPTAKANDAHLQSFSLRYLGYEFNPRNKFTWGAQYNVTLGRGLLMDYYNSAIGGNTQYITQKGGFLGEFGVSRIDTKVLWTGGNVKGGSLRYTFRRSPIFGAPLSLGTTYVTDTDGINMRLSDTYSVERPAVSGYAVDLALPIGGDFFTIYTEYAKLDTYGQGTSVGARGDLYGFFDYRAEFRQLGDSFVPNYFNSTYEITSFSSENIRAVRASTGFLAALSTQLFYQYVRAGIQYESYKDHSFYTASLGFRPIGPIAGVINYTVPFQGETRRVLESDLSIQSGLGFSYILNFKRVYSGTQDDYVDAYSFGARMDFARLWPF